MSENFQLLKYLQELSITSPTEIQSLCFQPLSLGKSVFVIAPTGSGKTLSFILPLLLRVDCEKRNIQHLILVPTRELGSQIARVAQQVADVIFSLDKKNILVRSAFGGSPIAKQMEELSKNPHVLIATPGRVIDLLERKAIPVKKLQALILDEADIMVGMGFAEQVEIICAQLPKELQVGLFSATQNDKVTELEEVLLKDKEYVVCNTQNLSSNEKDKKLHDSKIEHCFIVTNLENKFHSLVTYLKSFEEKNSGKIILFCHQRETAHEVAESLKKEGFAADALTGELGQVHRNSIMRNFKSGHLKYLVATNIASRGIDIDKLAGVIHYDVAYTPEDYIHRSGRTGRSGFAEGFSLTFCDTKIKNIYLKLMEDLGLSPEEMKGRKNKALDNAVAKPHALKSPSRQVAFIKVHINKGKQDKIRPGDILGAFIQELGLVKEDIGNIFIFNNFTHIEVNGIKKNLVLNKSFRVKNLAVKVVSAKG